MTEFTLGNIYTWISDAEGADSEVFSARRP